ncbi:hypothetical protein HMSSN036_16470 [Paenibacillus macerans]|nr:hypothetical protein HMSSN036_16470 [Paenibacillus macerans]
MAQPAQQPPQPGGVYAPLVVVRDDPGGIADPRPAQPLRERFRGGQRMPPAVRAYRCREIFLEVEKDGTGEYGRRRKLRAPPADGRAQSGNRQ